MAKADNDNDDYSPEIISRQAPAAGLVDDLLEGGVDDPELFAILSEIDAAETTSFDVSGNWGKITHKSIPKPRVARSQADPGAMTRIDPRGKVFLLTGKLSMTRADMESRLIAAGGRVVDRITQSNRIDYVLVGDKPGSKLAKAQARAVKEIKESDLILTLTA